MSEHPGARLRYWLAVARQIAETGDAEMTVRIVNTQFDLGFPVGPDVAATLLLHGEEFAATNDHRLPGLVRRLLRTGSDPECPLWRHQIQGWRILLESELTREQIDQASAWEPVMEANAGTEDPRVYFILDNLNDVERKTVLAWYTSGAESWREAAVAAGASRDPRFAERLRRKVRRLAKDWETAA
ncbi:hypothetical protein [Streptomyces sp. NPDC085937]|uniref:hypothetical protein n=1 Tax=Streptomyces sp. NPDC085937 TaxID=3365742 RepID=UPI0037CF934E